METFTYMTSFILIFVAIPGLVVYRQHKSIEKTVRWIIVFLALPIIGILVYIYLNKNSNSC